MKIGYARVSTHDQNLDLQKDALLKAGCERIFEDHISGGSTERPGLSRAMDALRPGDTLVVWRLDRLGRSLKHLIDTVTDLEEQGIGFKSVNESLDTTTHGGKLVFHIFGALAEFERSLIQERTRSGLAAARARGRLGGRPKKVSKQKLAMAKKMLEDRDQSVTNVAEVLGVSRATLYRHLKSERHGSDPTTAPA